MVPFVRVVLTVLFATFVVTSDLGPSSEPKKASKPIDPSELAEASPQHAVAYDPNEPRSSIQFSVEPDDGVDDEDGSKMSPDEDSADEDSGHTDTSTVSDAGDSSTQSGTSGISRTTSGSTDDDADEGTVPMKGSRDQTDTIPMDRAMSVQEFKKLVEKFSSGSKKLRDLCAGKPVCDEQAEENVDLDQTNGDGALNK